MEYKEIKDMTQDEILDIVTETIEKNEKLFTCTNQGDFDDVEEYVQKISNEISSKNYKKSDPQYFIDIF